MFSVSQKLPSPSPVEQIKVDVRSVCAKRSVARIDLFGSIALAGESVIEFGEGAM